MKNWISYVFSGQQNKNLRENIRYEFLVLNYELIKRIQNMLALKIIKQIIVIKNGYHQYKTNDHHGKWKHRKVCSESIVW